MDLKHWPVVFATGVCVLALGACAPTNSHKASEISASQSTKKTTKPLIKQSSKASASKQTLSAQSSSTSEAPQPATIQEKLAMVLQAPGAGGYSSAIAQSASPVSGVVTGAPAGSVVYSLSVEHGDKTPMILLLGDDAYLFATQATGIPYTWVHQNALHVDLGSTWTSDHNSATLKQLAQQLSLVSSTQQTISTDPENIDKVFRQYTASFSEDPSTVSGDGAQTSGFTQLDGNDQWWWQANKADGSTAYHMSLTDIQYVGNHTYTALGEQVAPPLDAHLTFTFTSWNRYTVKASDINYYGTFVK